MLIFFLSEIMHLLEQREKKKKYISSIIFDYSFEIANSSTEGWIYSWNKYRSFSP